MDHMKSFEVPTDMRRFAEQSVEQARKAFEGFAEAAQKAMTDMEGRAHAARTSMLDVSGRAMSYAEKNMAASFEFAQSLVRAKDVEEVLRLQTDFVKRQMQALSEQAKELTEASAQAAKGAAGPKGS